MSEIDDLVGSLSFRSVLKGTKDGLLLKPQLHNYFDDGHKPDVDLGRIAPHPLDNALSDGWFHPSTHPTWSARSLYHYLTRPERLVQEKVEYANTLAMMNGSLLHTVFQAAMEEMDLLPADLQKCHVCPPERNCKEPGVQDDEHGERGHMDGLLALPNRPRGGDVFEFKSAGRFGSRKMYKMDDLDLDAFKAAWPDYYAQAQSYLRMSGRRMSVLLMIELGFPFDMREFHIPLDRSYCRAVTEKYRTVRQAVANQRPPRCSCMSKARTACPSRRLCKAEIG